MAVNEFLTFAGDPAANVMAWADYSAGSFTTRLLGFQTGTALSTELNRVWRGSSLITAMIGQFSADYAGRDMRDDGTPAGMSALQLNFTDAVKNAAIQAIGTGFLPLTGGTLTGALTVQSPVNIAAPIGQWSTMTMTRSTNQGAQILSGNSANAWRWQLTLATAEPETGSNSGSNFAIARFNDAGVYLDTPVSIDRRTGVVHFAKPPEYAQGPLPYLPLTGGTVSGPVGIVGNGIVYNSFGGNYHAFGWDGPNGALNAFVDGTWVGTLATRAYVGNIAGAYLPLAGGTVTGNLIVRGSFNGTTGAFSSTVYFANASDFSNFTWDVWRIRQWAGSWWDGWDTRNGNRIWNTPSGRAMTLSGNADFYVTGTLRSQGGRTVTTENGQGFAPSTGLWNVANGIAMGMWLDPSYLWFGNLDASGNPTRGLFGIGNDGTVRVQNNLSVVATAYAANFSAANIIYAVGAISSGSSINANGNLSTNYDLSVAHVAYAPIFTASNYVYAQNYISTSGNMAAGGSIDVGLDMSVHRNTVTAGDNWANRHIAQGDILALNGWMYSGWNGAGTIMSDHGVHYHYDHGIAFTFRWDGKYFYRQINGGEREVIEGANGRVRALSMQASNLQWYDDAGYSWYANTFLSDAKFKRNIAPAEDFDSLGAILALPTRAYDWKEDWEQRHVPHGFLADEVRDLLPDAVITATGIEGADPTDFLDPVALIAHLVRAVRQLNDKLEGKQTHA